MAPNQLHITHERVICEFGHCQLNDNIISDNIKLLKGVKDLYQISVERNCDSDPLQQRVVSGLDAAVFDLLEAVERLIVDPLQLGRLQGRHHHVLRGHQIVNAH
jgi:hypothetical protein